MHEPMKIIDELKFTSRASYQILAKGTLDESWSGRLSGMLIENEQTSDGFPVVKLSGEVRDQSELLGILSNIYEIHLPIISLELVTGG